MKQTLYDLFKALLNATLILVALCLFLGWKLMSSVDAVTERVTDAVQLVTPLQDRVAGLQTEVAALRSEILTKPTDEIVAQMDRIDARLGQLQSEISEFKDLPAEVIQTAAQSGAAELGAQIGRLAACPAPEGS